MKIREMNVLITGGASGIGKIMGRIALEKGAKALIIWDVNQESLEATATEFASSGHCRGRVYTYKVDITNSDLVAQTYQQVLSDCGPVDILINCAGIVRGNNTFDQQSLQDIRLTMEVNAIAPMVIGLLSARSCLALLIRISVRYLFGVFPVSFLKQRLK